MFPGMTVHQTMPTETSPGFLSDGSVAGADMTREQWPCTILDWQSASDLVLLSAGHGQHMDLSPDRGWADSLESSYLFHYQDQVVGSPHQHPPPPPQPPTPGWESPPVKMEDADASLRFASLPAYAQAARARRHQHAVLASARGEPTAVRRTKLSDGGAHRQLRAAAPESLERSLQARSNYQNIMDGGATAAFYPDDFAQRVQSKRMAHKISEKARRDRLTAAIREMQELLPDGMCREMQDHDFDGNIPVSKAIVVESAIRYIRQLKADLASQKNDE